MPQRRLPVILLSAIALMAGCDQSTVPSRGDGSDEVLPAGETSKDFGDHTIHINAQTTDQLTPEIAKEYGIVRSKNRAMLTFSIHKNQEGHPAVSADVSASAVNLSGQLKEMSVREIAEGEAIYYIGSLVINDGETLIYTVDARPVDTDAELRVRFKRRFFTN